MDEVSGSAAVLTPEERRERRKARILAASDQRLSRILSGPDGSEKRMAPAMDGGDFRSSTVNVPATNGNGVNAPRLEVDDLPKFPTLVEMGVKYDPPRFFTYIRTARCKVVSLVALMFFILSTMDMISSVLVPWSILFVSYSIIEKKACVSPYPNHGYLVNGLMWAGFSEDVVVTLGFLIESVSSYMTDTATLLFIFVSTSAVRDTALLLTA